MRVVTATIVFKGTSQFGQRTVIYPTLEVGDYKVLVSYQGKHILNNSNGQPIMVDMDEVAGITCGPERDAAADELP